MKVNSKYINKILDLLKSCGISMSELAFSMGIDTKEIYNIRARKKIKKEFHRLKHYVYHLQIE